MKSIQCAISIVIALMLALAAGGVSAQSSGTGICSDHSGRNFPCSTGGGGPRGPTQTEILNTDLYNLLKRLVKDTDLRWGDLPDLNWGKTLRSAAALTDRVFAGTRRRYYSEQRRRTYAEADLRAVRTNAGAASTALRDSSNKFSYHSKRYDTANRRHTNLAKQLRSTKLSIKRRRTSIVRIQNSVDEIRNRFYDRARNISFLSKNPSAYRAALSPPSPVYGNHRGSATRTGAPAVARAIIPRRVSPAVRAAAVDLSNAFQQTRPNATAVRKRFREIEKTAKFIRSERVRADRAEASVRRLRNSTGENRLKMQRLDQKTVRFSDKAADLENQLVKLESQFRRARARLRKADDGLVKSVVEWAAWQEMDRRLQTAVNQLTVTRVIELSGVNKVRDVMKAAAALAGDLFTVLRETPQALIHEPSAIPRLERDIDTAVHKFHVSFHSNITGLPEWLIKIISRHTRK